MKVRFHRKASLEYHGLADFYEIQREGKGIEFTDEVDRIWSMLADVRLGPQIDARHRRVSMHGFPYGIIYRVDGSEVIIIAIAHDRRRPFWLNR